MTNAILRKMPSGLLLPIGEESVATINSYRIGSDLAADIHGDRNLAQLRKFWKLADITADATDMTKEDVKSSTALALGYRKIWFEPNSCLHVDAASIAVDRMKQDVFDPFFDRAVALMASWIGVDKSDLLRQFNESAADKRYVGLIR